MSEVLKQVDDRSNFHHGERMKLRFQALVLCQSKIEGLWVVCCVLCVVCCVLCVLCVVCVVCVWVVCCVCLCIPWRDLCH